MPVGREILRKEIDETVKVNYNNLDFVLAFYNAGKEKEK